LWGCHSNLGGRRLAKLDYPKSCTDGGLGSLIADGGQTHLEIPWSEFRTFIHDLGLLRGLFAIFFLGMHAWVFALYNGRLQD